MDRGSNEVIDQENKHFYSLYSFTDVLSLLKTNLTTKAEGELQTVLSQRLQKSLVFAGQGAVVPVEFCCDDGSSSKSACYYYLFDEVQTPFSIKDDKDTPVKHLVCFIALQEESLDLFRVDLDKYCTDVIQPQISTPESTLSTSLETWHAVAVEYLLRCKQSLRDNLKYLIHSALLDNKLVMSGGTTELQTDIQRFYSACSLSDILSQLRESRLQQESGSLSGSVDMLVDVDNRQTDIPTTITVSISDDSVKLDSNGCNKFCEEWANALMRPEFQNNPTRLKQVIEAYKLKFIQTMNTLKRLLREADNDYYALYRSYEFLRDSGNHEILLHYVTAETVVDANTVIGVLQDFIHEQQT